LRQFSVLTQFHFNQKNNIMHPLLYPIALSTLLIAVIFHFVADKNSWGKKYPALFLLLGAAVYIAVLYFDDTPFKDKMFWIIPKDFAILTTLTAILLRVKQPGWLLPIVLIATFFYSKNCLKPNPLFINASRTGEILFDIKRHDDLPNILKQLAPYDVKVHLAFPNILHPEITDLDEYYVLDIPDNLSYQGDRIINILNKSGLIDDLEINNLFENEPVLPVVNPIFPATDYAVNDPMLNNVWAFETGQFNTYFNFIKSTPIKPAKKARIAILDTGVDATHEDLKSNYVSIDPNSDKDSQEHGTHCAGIAAATTANGIGIASFATAGEFVEVTSIQVLGPHGGSDESVIGGMIRAVDAGADVLSMSLGGRSADSKQRAFNQAVAYAKNRNAIVVVAAGNESSDARNYVPANCKGVIVVSATDKNNEKATFSNSVEFIEFGLAAPGVNIYSTLPNNRYGFFSGTSMATPYIAGLVGILKAFQPNFTMEDAYFLLKNTGVDTRNTRQTGKLVQPATAIRAIAR
jgi:thermitase